MNACVFNIWIISFCRVTRAICECTIGNVINRVNIKKAILGTKINVSSGFISVLTPCCCNLLSWHCEVCYLDCWRLGWNVDIYGDWRVRCIRRCCFSVYSVCCNGAFKWNDCGHWWIWWIGTENVLGIKCVFCFMFTYDEPPPDSVLIVGTSLFPMVVSPFAPR